MEAALGLAAKAQHDPERIFTMRFSTCIFALLTGSLTLASTASASSGWRGPAFGSVPANAAEAACWTHSYGTVTNTCSGSRRLCMTVHHEDSPGSTRMYVQVSAHSDTPANHVSCFAQAVDLGGAPTSSSPVFSVTAYGTSNFIGDGLRLNGYGGENLYICCDVPTGGRVNSWTAVWED